MQNEGVAKATIIENKCSKNLIVIVLYRYRAGQGKNDYCPEFVRNGVKRPALQIGVCAKKPRKPVAQTVYEITIYNP